MRQECVVPESQCAIKRESKRAQKEHKDKPNSTTRDTPNGNGGLRTPLANSALVTAANPITTHTPISTTSINGQHIPALNNQHTSLPTPLTHSQQQNTHHLPTNTNQALHQTATMSPQTALPGHPQAHIGPGTPVPSGSVSGTTPNHTHHPHQAHLPQNHHLNGATTTISGQVPPGQTQLSINSNYHHSLQTPHHQVIGAGVAAGAGVTPHGIQQLANHHIQQQPPPLANHSSLSNGQFAPNGISHSSPPNHLAINGIDAAGTDPLIASNNRLTALQQTHQTSLSPLSNHNTSVGTGTVVSNGSANNRFNFISSNPAPNQNLTIEQCLQIRAKQILEDRIGIINDLIRYQDEFDTPKEEDLRNVAPYNEGQGENQLKHFTEMTILTVKLIVEFAKKVYGFETLTREDQITLLKASASEVMMLRSTRKYDIKTDSILFANNQPFTRENYRKAHIGEIADAMFNFCRSTVILRLDPAEYALITALIIFSERPNLREPEKVEGIQEFYLELMQAYVESREQSEKCKFARLLSLLPELRALGIVNSDVCFSLRVKNQRLPEFLAEIWDVNQEKQDNED